MNKTELQQKIVDMEKQIAELKKELDKKDKGIWKPEVGEGYYFIDEKCEECVTNNYGAGRDKEIFECGNCYKTKEEAMKQANYLKYTNLLRKYVEEHSEPLDWQTNQRKFHLYYDLPNKKIKCWSDIFIQNQGTIYASSEEVLKDAISFLGEENIKRYIFFIEE